MTTDLAGALSAYTGGVTDFLQHLTDANADALGEAVAAIGRAGLDGHLVYAAGAGHSLGGVIEMFYRAGGLPFVSPLWAPRVMPLNGALESTAAEREPGVGDTVGRSSAMAAGDVLVVYSNSGINAYPIELATYARSVGVTVIAVTSRRASAAAPLRAGSRLMDLADIVLDTDVPPGDVSWPSTAAEVAPLSSLAGVHLWNLIMVGLKETLPDLAVWRSANTGGDDSHNEGLVLRYGRLIPAMS